MNATPETALPPSLTSGDPDYQRERYTVRQAAAYLGVSVGQIYRLTSTGAIACRKVGRLAFSQADLDEFRAAHRQPARERSARPRQAAVEIARAAQPLKRRTHYRFQ
jgi:excisionase family DNA binding protein